MNTIKLHAEGETDFLDSLKKTFNDLKNKLIKNPNLSEKEKSDKLKEINAAYETAKKNAAKNLF